jgi:imidazolonepropionase-like amidohydrolase
MTVRQDRNTPAGLLLISLALSLAQTLCGAETITAIQGGDLYTITSGVVKGGALLIEDGKIAQIGQGVEIPKNAKVIDAKGKVVMPGLVAAATWSMPAVDSGSEKLAESLDPFHYSVSLALASGVTSIFVGGDGGPPWLASTREREPIGGTNAVIKPTFGDLDSMLVKEPVALNCYWGRRAWMQRTEFALKMRQAREYLQKLAAYERARARKEKAKTPPKAEGLPEKEVAVLEPPEEKRPELEAPQKPPGIDPYIRLLKRELPARLEAERASEILAVLELVDEFKFRLILEGAVEAWTVADQIARRDVKVIITPRAKRQPNEQISRPSGSSVESAAVLSKAGVKFAIVPPEPYFATWDGGRDLMTLPLDAALAVAGGLDEQTALEAITITAAEILGIDDRVGSLQAGKDADIIVLDGHPFHRNTFVQLTFVNGKLLYEKSKSSYFSHIRSYDDAAGRQPSPEQDVRKDRPPSPR